MLEDLRNHEAEPNAQEREWMRFDPFAMAVKLVALAGLAVAIGVSASQIIGPSPAETVVAAHE